MWRGCCLGNACHMQCWLLHPTPCPHHAHLLQAGTELLLLHAMSCLPAARTRITASCYLPLLTHKSRPQVTCLPGIYVGRTELCLWGLCTYVTLSETRITLNVGIDTLLALNSQPHVTCLPAARTQITASCYLPACCSHSTHSLMLPACLLLALRSWPSSTRATPTLRS